MRNDLIRKNLWILDTLYRTGGITFAELCRCWERSADNDSKEPLQRRTFINCKEAIQRNFKIDIACDSSDGYKYYIKDIADLRNGGPCTWKSGSWSCCY